MTPEPDKSRKYMAAKLAGYPMRYDWVYLAGLSDADLYTLYRGFYPSPQGNQDARAEDNSVPETQAKVD
jgi:hypothetical protein